ncbi:MAG: ABC transporter ATP-binding protein [Patescibacteria group bacterium]|jgi:ABC-type multidrug transport system fused ATPase/permease subunit
MDEPQKQENISVKEFFDLSLWNFKFIYSLEKTYTAAYTASAVLRGSRGILNTLIISRLLDVIISQIGNGNSQIRAILPYMWMLLAYSLISSALTYINDFFSNGLNERLRPRLERALYTKMNLLGVQSMENPSVTNRLTRSRESLFDMHQHFTRNVNFLSSLVSLLIASSLILKSMPVVFLIVTVIAIPTYFYDKKYRIKNWRIWFDSTEERRKTMWTSGMLTNPKEITEVNINGSFDFLDKRYKDFYDWFIQKNTQLRKKWFAGLYTFDIFSNLGIFYGYALVFSKLISGVITVGNVYFITNLINRLDDEINYVFSQITSMFENSLRLKDIYYIFHAEPAFEDGSVDLGILVDGPSIDIQNLSFHYPTSEKIILKNINLKISAGEKIAVVGANGAGKTTLVKLLSKIYLPTEGKIIVNDTDLKDIKGASWHQNIGVLFQDYNTYGHLSAKENITIGDPDSEESTERVTQASKRADALEFIEEYPKKFDQILSERFKDGIRPSSGQWQKIAIARFFYRDSPLVIFDEPTAAIDAISEYNIFNEIYKFFENKTVVIISHRFSTVRNADRIIVLEKGEVVEQGKHNELIEKEGYYARAFKLQAEGYQN